MTEWKDTLAVLDSFLNVLLIPAVLVLYNIKGQLIKLTSAIEHLNTEAKSHDERIKYIERRSS